MSRVSKKHFNRDYRYEAEDCENAKQGLEASMLSFEDK